MCFLLTKHFFRVTIDSETGIAPFSCLHCQQEMKFQHCWLIVARMLFWIFLLGNFTGKPLFQLDIKILTLFSLEWVRSGFNWSLWTLNKLCFRARLSDYSQLECRAWLKLCRLDTQFLSFKLSRDYFFYAIISNDDTLTRSLKLDGTWFECCFWSNLETAV